MSHEDWSDFDNPPPLGGRRPRGSRGRGGRRSAPRESYGFDSGYDEPVREAHPEPRRRRVDAREYRDPAQAEAPRRRRPAEETVWKGSPDWRALGGYYAKGAVVVFLVTLMGIFACVAGVLPKLLLPVVTLLAAAAVHWIAALIRRTTTYLVTTRRVQRKWGIVVKHSEEAPLRRVQNISVSQGLLERLLGIGTLDFDTAGERDGEELLRFWGVRRPWAVRAQIDLDDEDDF